MPIKVQTFSHGSNIIYLRDDLNRFFNERQDGFELVKIETFLNNGGYQTIIIYKEPCH